MADITYFQGAELQDFAAFSTTPPVHSTAGGYFRAGNARCSIECGSGSEDSRYSETSAFSASEIWSHFTFAMNLGTGFNGTQHNFAKWYAGGVNRIALRQSAAGSSQIEARKWNGSTWETIGISGPLGLAPGTLYTFDVYIKLGNPGSIRVYLDKLPIISDDTVNLALSGVSALDRFRLGTFSSTTSTAARYSEVIVASWNTIGAKLVTGSPRANGAYSEWSGLGFSALNEITPAATYMTSGAADQRISVPMTSFPALAAGERIERVKVAVNALRDASGPQKMNVFARVAMADDHRADRALNVAVADYTEAWEMSPATSTYWTPTELNASEFGVRSRA